MLELIQIKNFKAIKDVTLDDLSHINYLVGPNASGKSSVLQCLQYIRACQLSGPRQNVLQLDCKTVKDARQIETYFKDAFFFKIQQSVALDNGVYRRDEATIEVKGKPTRENHILTFPSYESYLKGDKTRRHKPFEGFFGNNYSTKYLDTHNTNFRIEIIRDPQEYWSISDANRNEAMLETLLDDINYVLKEILESPDEIVINECGEAHISSTNEPIHLGELSSGIRTFATFRYLLRQASTIHSGLLIVEEPETSLNPGVQKKVPEIIEAIIDDALGKDASKIQLFISTHSPFVLSGIKSVKPKRDFIKIATEDEKVIPLIQKVYLLEDGKLSSDHKESSGVTGPRILSQASALLGFAVNDLVGKHNADDIKRLPNLRIIFVEGKDAILFANIFGDNQEQKTLFIPTGGFQSTLNSYYSLKDILPGFFGARRTSILAIVDRSISNGGGTYVGNGKTISTEGGHEITNEEYGAFIKYHEGENIHMLKRREVENYLSDPKVIAEAFPDLSSDYSRYLETHSINVETANIKDLFSKSKDKTIKTVWHDKTRLAESKAFKELVTQEIEKLLKHHP